MTIKRRLDELERAAREADGIRAILLPEGLDHDQAREQHRRETGFRGIIVPMDEADLAL